MKKEELKKRKDAAKIRRKQESLMRDFAKLDAGHCGHADCESFNAAARGIAAAIDWALAQGMPTEWVGTLLSKGATMAVVVNHLTIDDLNGQKSERQSREAN